MSWLIAAIDDETLTRDGLAALEGDDFEVVAAYQDVESFLKDPRRLDVDVVILDLWIRSSAHPDPVRGSSAITAIRAACPKSRIVLYTSEERPLVLARLIQLGAAGVVLKTDTRDSLRDAIARVAKGEIVLTTSLIDLAYVCARDGKLPQLTPTQRKVLQWRARGLSYERIASTLNYSVGTVDKAICTVNRIFADFATTSDMAELLDDGQPSAAAIADMLGVNVDDLLDEPDRTKPRSERRNRWRLLRPRNDRR